MFLLYARGAAAYADWPGSPWESLEVVWAEDDGSGASGETDRISPWDAVRLPMAPSPEGGQRDPNLLYWDGAGDAVQSPAAAAAFGSRGQDEVLPVDEAARLAIALEECCGAEEYSPFRYPVDAAVFPDYYKVSLSVGQPLLTAQKQDM